MLPSLVVVVHTVTRPRGIAKRLPTPVYTPAYAGKTLLSLPAASCIWGTPPRMRGKRTFRQSNSGYPEHPRVCGENVEVPTPSASAISGTPPRMRGKRQRHDLASGKPRNTPAYAGKTTASKETFAPCGEHPRVCGENCRLAGGVLLFQGTPPRMRGKHFATSTFTGCNPILASLRAVTKI